MRLKWRKAISLSWSGELEKAEILLNEIKNNEDTDLKEQIEISCKNLLDRKSSIKIKVI